MLYRDSPVAAFAFSRSISKDFPSIVDPNRSCFSLEQWFINMGEDMPSSLNPAEQAMRLDGLNTLQEDYLQKVDVSSMAFSLESREPLLDQTIIEWAMRLPLTWKLKGSRNKYLLRKLLYRYVPQKVVDRPKQGFVVPIELLPASNPESSGVGILNVKAFSSRSFPVEQQQILKLFRLHESGKRNVYTRCFGRFSCFWIFIPRD